MPKPVAMAMEELAEDEIYHRTPEADDEIK